MCMERTPPFTLEGSEEILHELEHGSPNTPERLATFRRADALTFLVERELAASARRARDRHHAEMIMSLDPTPPFTPEGTGEILHELEHGSPDTPERRRMFVLMDRVSVLMDEKPRKDRSSP